MKTNYFYFIFLIFLVSCTRSIEISEISLISTQEISLENFSSTYKIGTRQTFYTELFPTDFLILLPLGRIPSIQEALQELSLSLNCVGFSNSTLELRRYYIPLFYGAFYYKVEGSPIYERKD